MSRAQYLAVARPWCVQLVLNLFNHALPTLAKIYEKYNILQQAPD